MTSIEYINRLAPALEYIGQMMLPSKGCNENLMDLQPGFVRDLQKQELINKLIRNGFNLACLQMRFLDALFRIFPVSCQEQSDFSSLLQAITIAK